MHLQTITPSKKRYTKSIKSGNTNKVSKKKKIYKTRLTVVINFNFIIQLQNGKVSILEDGGLALAIATTITILA